MTDVNALCLQLPSPPHEWAVRLLVRQQILRRRYLAEIPGAGGVAVAAETRMTGAEGPSAFGGTLSGLAAAVERAFCETP